MAYMNQEKKAKIAAALKPILAKYGVKGTLRVRNHMAIQLTISQGKLDFIGDMNDERHNLLGSQTIDKAKLREAYHLDINTYWCHEHYKGKTKQFLAEAIPAMKAAEWYNNSDIQTDYFDTAYYFDITVGKWNKPYVLTK